MQESKLYRVVCSQLPHSNEVFIDIAPTDANKFGVTHEMMFYSRMKLSGETLESCGIGSVFLKENDWHDPEIDFSQGFHAPKGTIEYESYLRTCGRLEPQILQTFKQMRAEGKSSTLGYIMSISEVEAYKEHIALHNGLSEVSGFSARQARKRQKFAEKHRDLLKPQQPETDFAASFGEEQIKHDLEETAAAERRRQNKLEDMANARETEDVIAIMRRKMKMYDGD